MCSVLKLNNPILISTGNFGVETSSQTCSSSARLFSSRSPAAGSLCSHRGTPWAASSLSRNTMSHLLDVAESSYLVCPLWTLTVGWHCRFNLIILFLSLKVIFLCDELCSLVDVIYVTLSAAYFAEILFFLSFHFVSIIAKLNVVMAIILIWHDFPIVCHRLHLLVSIEILNMSVYHCDLINSTLYLCPSYFLLCDVTIHDDHEINEYEFYWRRVFCLIWKSLKLNASYVDKRLFES